MSAIQYFAVELARQLIARGCEWHRAIDAAGIAYAVQTERVSRFVEVAERGCSNARKIVARDNAIKAEAHDRYAAMKARRSNSSPIPSNAVQPLEAST